MKIEIAKICGLCSGCQNAINRTLTALNGNKKVILFKELVHNDMVNKELIEKGATIKNSLDEINANEKVVLRAHGEPPSTYNYLHKKNIEYIDCTCPLVQNVHKMASEYSKQGYIILLIGKPNHPEVIGTLGYVHGKYYLVCDEADIDTIKINDKSNICILYQTTFNEQKALKIFEKISNKFKDVKIINKNTICPIQKRINLSSMSLATECKLMMVVGNKNSSNTKELFNNLQKNIKTIFISDIKNWQQCLKEEKIDICTISKIGITAGASTRKEDLIKLKKSMMEYYK